MLVWLSLSNFDWKIVVHGAVESDGAIWDFDKVYENVPEHIEQVLDSLKMGHPSFIKAQTQRLLENLLYGNLFAIDFGFDDSFEYFEEFGFGQKPINVWIFMNNVQEPQIFLPVLKTSNEQIPRIIQTQLPLLNLLLVWWLDWWAVTTQVSFEGNVSWVDLIKFDKNAVNVFCGEFVAFHPCVHDFLNDYQLFSQVVFESVFNPIGREAQELIFGCNLTDLSLELL